MYKNTTKHTTVGISDMIKQNTANNRYTGTLQIEPPTTIHYTDTLKALYDDTRDR